MKRKQEYDFELKQEYEWIKYDINDLFDTEMFKRSKIKNLSKHYNMNKPDAIKRAKGIFLEVFEMMIIDLIENGHYFVFPRVDSCYLELHEYDPEINFADSPDRVKFILAMSKRMKKYTGRNPEFEPSRRIKSKIKELKKRNHGFG